MLSPKQSNILDEIIGLYSKESVTQNKLTGELIVAMDEEYLEAFMKDFFLDKDGIDTYYGKSIRGATHYAKLYIEKSMDEEVSFTMAHIKEIRYSIVHYRPLTPESYSVYFNGELIADKQTIIDNEQNMFHYLKTTEAKLKEMALKKRGVDTMCSYLSEEPIVQLEYTH